MPYRKCQHAGAGVDAHHNSERLHHKANTERHKLHTDTDTLQTDVHIFKNTARQKMPHAENQHFQASTCAHAHVCEHTMSRTAPKLSTYVYTNSASCWPLKSCIVTCIHIQMTCCVRTLYLPLRSNIYIHTQRERERGRRTMSRRRALLPRDVLGDTERERQTMRV